MPIPREVLELRQVYQQAQIRMITIIAAKKARGNVTVYQESILRQINKELATLDQYAKTWARDNISTSYRAGAERSYNNLRRANLTMSDIVIDNRRVMLMAENVAMQFVDAHRFVGRQLNDYVRQAGIEAVSQKFATAATVKETKKLLIEKLTSHGITGIRDKAGRLIRLDAYAELVARSTTREATNTATLDQLQAHGYDLVQMSSHASPCPICVTGDTLVSGPVANLGIRREYSGELVKISTASGKNLTGTPDHPVLTPDGWCPLDKLKPGDKVISETDINGTLNRRGVMPNEIQMPARIDDIFEAFPPTARVDIFTSPAGSNFDSDVVNSKINIIGADSSLLGKRNFTFSKLSSNGSLISRIRLALKSSRKSSLLFRLCCLVTSTPSIVSRLHKFLAFFVVPFRPTLDTGMGSNRLSFVGSPVFCGSNNTMRSRTGLDTKALQIFTDGSVANSKHRTELCCSFAGLIEAAYFLSLRVGQFSQGFLGSLGFSSLNECSDPYDADVEFGRQLIRRLSSGVTVDDIITVERSQFNGHVYDLQTSPHWYVANSIISHNCAPLEGRVYSISGSDNRYPPLERAYSGTHANIHVNCLHVLTPYIEKFDDNAAKTQRDSNRSFDTDPRSKAQQDAYNAAQRKNTVLRNDRNQWEKYRAKMPDDTPATFSAFRRSKTADGPKYNALESKYRSLSRQD